MPRPLIHIGYHKSASSWLQRYLFGSGDRGFVPLAPPNHGMANPSKFLSRFFIFDEEDRLLSPFRSRLAEVRDLLGGMEIPESGVPVLSQERLSGSPHSSGFDAKAIAGRLKEAFPEGRVLIVIREQRSMTLSNYFQFLRIGGAMALGDYISGKYDGRLPGFSPNHFKYDGLIEHYQELFGNESVLVLPFELFCSDPRSFVARVAKFSEAEVPEDLEYGDRLNKGLPRLVEYRTRALNYLAYRDSTNGYSPWASRAGFRIVRWLHRQLIRVVPDSTEAKFVEGLRAEIADFTGDCYAESNRRTEAMTGLDLRSLGYK